MELAVVASRTAGVSELVEDRLNGRLVPPDDPAALAAALAMLIRDPAARLPANTLPRGNSPCTG